MEEPVLQTHRGPGLSTEPPP